MDFVDFLDAYVDESLSPLERQVFDGHLAECSWCREYLDQYRTTVRLAGASPSAEEELTPPEELIQAILAARKTPD